MITFTTKTGYAVPIEEYDKIQKKNLEMVKFKGKQIKDFDKLTAYYPEIKFKNVVRKNADKSMDIIVDSSVAEEIRTGSLPRRMYKAIRITQEPGLLGFTKSNFDIIQVPESEIISQFNQSLPISEVGEILEASIKKGVKYFG